jgi:hypothetical protein
MYYVEIYTYDYQYLNLRMELTLRQEYRIKYCMMLVTVINSIIFLYKQAQY